MGHAKEAAHESIDRLCRPNRMKTGMSISWPHKTRRSMPKVNTQDARVQSLDNYGNISSSILKGTTSTTWLKDVHRRDYRTQLFGGGSPCTRAGGLLQEPPVGWLTDEGFHALYAEGMLQFLLNNLRCCSCPSKEHLIKISSKYLPPHVHLRQNEMHIQCSCYKTKFLLVWFKFL